MNGAWWLMIGYVAGALTVIVAVWIYLESDG